MANCRSPIATPSPRTLRLAQAVQASPDVRRLSSVIAAAGRELPPAGFSARPRAAAGRIDFAPAVVDLSAEGFPLIGGRLDYVAGKRVAAVVYKRRQHTISVFMWPVSQGGVASGIKARNGYNIACFTRNALAYCAVSDLNANDLAQLESLL